MKYNCLVVHVTWYYTAYCIYVYTKAREDEFRELYRSYWRLAGLTDELWRTALVFTKSTSVKTGGQAPPLPNASYATGSRQFLRAKYVGRNVFRAHVRILIAPWRVLAIVRAAFRALLAGGNARSRGQDGSVNTHRRM